jgi:hypothetical protein
VYDGTSYTRLDDPLGTVGTFAQAINNLGQVTGRYWMQGGFFPFVYGGGNFVTLNEPFGLDYQPAGINDAGQLVGAVPLNVGFDEDEAFLATPNNIPVTAGGSMELSNPYAGNITFAGTSGTFKFDSSNVFAGTVAGMTGQDTLDFADIDPNKVHTPTFSGTSSHGTLTVTDGSHTANVILLGNYLSSTFVASSDGHGGTNVIDPPAPDGAQPLVTPAHS